MNKTYTRDKRGWSRLWILPVLIMMALCVDSARGTCPECQAPNPDYDPNNPYETDEPCIPLDDGAEVPGEPCKECRDGEVVNKDAGEEVDGEPCKECDGQGGIRFKSDGQPCTGSTSGRCCNNDCVDPADPPTCGPTAQPPSSSDETSPGPNGYKDGRKEYPRSMAVLIGKTTIYELYKLTDIARINSACGSPLKVSEHIDYGEVTIQAEASYSFSYKGVGLGITISPEALKYVFKYGGKVVTIFDLPGQRCIMHFGEYGTVYKRHDVQYSGLYTASEEDFRGNMVEVHTANVSSFKMGEWKADQFAQDSCQEICAP